MKLHRSEYQKTANVKAFSVCSIRLQLNAFVTYTHYTNEDIELYLKFQSKDSIGMQAETIFAVIFCSSSSPLSMSGSTLAGRLMSFQVCQLPASSVCVLNNKHAYSFVTQVITGRRLRDHLKKIGSKYQTFHILWHKCPSGLLFLVLW